METKHSSSSIIGWLFKLFGYQKTSTSSNQSQVTFSELSTNTKTFSSNCVSHTNSISSLVSSPSCAQSRSLVLSAPFRFTRTYDVYVCHSTENATQAGALVSFLETSNRGLRCYWQPRDSSLGAALSTELCMAIQASHCWVLLLSPQFMQDEWCWYQMQQVISEGSMSHRVIPIVLDMRISEIPKELSFFYTVNLSQNLEMGYSQVYRAVLKFK